MKPSIEGASEFAGIVAVLFSIELVRYLLIPAALFLVFTFILRGFANRRSLYRSSLSKRRVGFEIGYSISTILIFSLIGAAPYVSYLKPYAKIYRDVALYGWPWLGVSFILLFIVFDAYFYWTHVALHKFKRLRRFHRIHHVSENPTPLATHSFHPAEALIHVVWTLPLVFLIPIHINILIAFNTLTLIHNAFAHSGVEIYPRRWLRRRLFNYLSTPSFHQSHHHDPSANFGLTFLWWDKWMGTYRSPNGDARDS